MFWPKPSSVVANHNWIHLFIPAETGRTLSHLVTTVAGTDNSFILDIRQNKTKKHLPIGRGFATRCYDMIYHKSGPICVTGSNNIPKF